MPAGPLFFDGAFGTYYLRLTGDERPCELANRTDAQTVRKIHREYLEAGSNAIKTNTFAANPSLEADPERLYAVIKAGWENACAAAKPYGARVFADIGGSELETAAADYEQISGWFLSLGAKDFLFETLAEYALIVPAVEKIKKVAPDASVFVSFAVSPDGYTRRGLHYRTLLGEAWENGGIDAAGLNCVCGPSHMLKLAGSLGGFPKPFIAMPNAGYPSAINGRVVFEDNADYFAQKLAELYETGADILGGCCGSTPRHIALASERVRRAERREKTVQPSGQHGISETRRKNTDFLARTDKVIAVELDPPLDYDCSFLLSASASLKADGADMITIADSPLSRPRADSVMMAARIRREAGIEVLPHITCRDRNQNALKASLLGAASEGISRILALTGDPPIQTGGRKPDGVFSFNSYDLISFIESLNDELFTENPFLVAGALNVNAVNFPAELARAQRKVALGAKMLFSQPIFSREAVENFRAARAALGCKLFAGILPVAGYRNAVFLANEVSGIEIPPDVVERLRDKTPEEAAEISIAYSARIARQIYDEADGFYIMTPLRRVAIVRGLMREIKKMGETGR